MAEALVKDLIEEERSRRQARRLAVREFRPRRAFAGLAAALVVTAAGGIAAIELLAATLHSGVHPVPGMGALVHALRHHPWRDAGVREAAAATAGCGLLFLLAALPGRLRGVPLDGADPRLAGVVRRSALRRAAADAALTVPGIERTRARGLGLLRRRLVVRTVTHYRNPANLEELVHAAVTARLERIEPMHRPLVDVRLRWRKD
ncbi:DUF6286 domain-containing protein [Actinomadura violacea]|uniref:DUF6286 domain-containing protein n=1 Tax=Actinomadura violacea TaxID=2819934 RepID=A0ABS3RI70_9ACTN|nr:DUF6286 domain-containing protein [Actinomadura violacea]MBO2456434.1 hypothetical protein [Actinomadura violacea]